MQIKCKLFLPLLYISILFAFPVNSFSQDTKVIDSLTAELRKAEVSGNDSLIALSLSRLALHHSTNQPELALKYSRRQLEIAKKIGYKWAIANSYNVQGGAYSDKGDYNKSLEVYEKAIRAFNDLNRRNDIVDINNSIGIVFAKQGIYSEALKYMLKALKLAMDEKYDRGIMSTYNNIGIVYEFQKQYDQSLKYYLNCLRMQRKLNTGYEHATLSNIGNLYLTKKQPLLALKYYNEGIQDAIEEDDDPSLANNYSGMGDAYIYTKEWDKALDNHMKAFEIRKGMDDIFGLKSSYLSLGKIYYKTGDYAKALDFTQKAAHLVKQTGELTFQADVHSQLSDIYNATGNYKLAYENLNLYKQYNDSIFNADNTKKLTEQQLNFDFKLREEKKEAEAKQELKYQANIRNYTIGGLLLIAVFIFILLRQRYKLATIRKQKAHEVAMQKLENEMAVKELESQALKAQHENSLLKEEKLQEKLDFNNRELASATMYLYQKNEMLSGLRKEIDNLPESDANARQLEKIRSAIQNDHHAETDWEKFKIHFEQVHPDFFKDLLERYPGLTPYEVRLCAYLHLKMATKEIAGLLNITPESVIKAKVRLNKKLNASAGNNEASN